MIFRNYLKEAINKEEIILLLKKNCGEFIKKIGNYPLWRGYKKINDIKKIISRENRKPKDMDENVHEVLDELFKKNFGWKARSEGIFVSGDYKTTYAYGTPYIFFPIGKYKYLWNPTILDLYSEYDESEGYNAYIHGIEGSNDYNYDEWEREYGENEDGYWKHPDINGTFNTMDELEDEIRDLEDESLSSINADWVPGIEYEIWVEEKEKDLIFSFEKQMEEDVRGYYHNKLLENAIKSKTEIMFKCKEYYLVEWEYVKSIFPKYKVP